MTQVSTAVEEKAQAKLPGRDWILLPTLALMTVFVMVALLVLLAHETFAKTTSGTKQCLNMNDPTGVRGIPNCEVWEKNPEAPLVNYKFNACGHRAGMECTPKRSGTFRIVIVGSSFAFGQDVAREKTLAALLPIQLSQRTGRNVELYNTAMSQGYARTVAMHFDEALAAQPDIVLWVLTKYDLERATVVGADLNFIPASASKSARAKIEYRVRQIMGMKDNRERIGFVEQYAEDLFRVSEVGTMLMHGLYQSQSAYMKAALSRSGDRLWYVESAPSSASREYLAQFDGYAAQILEKAKAAGVPLVATLAPDRVQAALLSSGEWSADFNPLRLDEEVRSIIVNHGGTYVDLLPSFRNILNSEQYYLPVDGHPDERWQPIVADILTEKLTDGTIPALKVAAPLTAQEQKR
jgi:hypothetical protein